MKSNHKDRRRYYGSYKICTLLIALIGSTFISLCNLEGIPCSENIKLNWFAKKVQKENTTATMSISIFGSEFEKLWPRSVSSWPRLTEFGQKVLADCKDVRKPPTNVKNIDIGKFIRKSSQFPREFGTNTCRVMNQPKDRYERIREQITSTYPVIHERTLALYLNFLEHKNKFGNPIELKVYKKLTLTGLVQRLLAKRCVAFLGSDDFYLLLDGTKSLGGYESIGTEHEQAPLMLANVISYDEVKLSALLSVSSHSEFINDGNRHNCGVVEVNKSLIEREGVIIGLIGGRFEREQVMEYQDIIISKEQNTPAHGYGHVGEPKTREQDYRRIWREFYEEPDFLYERVTKVDERFSYLADKKRIFDNLLMKKRYTISIDTLLLESEARAVAAGKPAYVHVVGIGLGVWQVAEKQTNVFLETFEQRLKALIGSLPHVGCVHFSWFRLNEWRSLQDGALFESETHPDGGIRIKISKRNPAEKLKEDMLPIVSYAWDANALPGNEFWLGSIAGSGDPAAASSTLITELHNPHINTVYANGDNLHIVSEKFGLLHIAEYARRRLANI